MLVLDNVYCESPVLLYNQAMTPILLSMGCYYYDGEKRNISNIHLSSLRLLRKFFSPRRLFGSIVGMTAKVDEANKYYCVDDDGVVYDLFILVGCGKCDMCRNKKSSEIVRRLQFHATAYVDTPFFVTLTYDDNHLPSDGVSRRHLQLFLKKLRHAYKGITFAYCSEYGSKTFRPHYHLLIWNVESNDNVKMHAFYRACCDAWTVDNRCVGAGAVVRRTRVGSLTAQQRGLVYIEKTDGKKALYKYVGKYITKGASVPAGKNKTFFQCSHNMGTLSPQYNNMVEYLRHGLFSTPFLLRTATDVCEYVIPSYFVNKILPSKSRQTYKSRVLVNQWINDDKSFIHDVPKNIKTFIDANNFLYGLSSPALALADDVVDTRHLLDVVYDDVELERVHNRRSLFFYSSLARIKKSPHLLNTIRQNNNLQLLKEKL